MTAVNFDDQLFELQDDDEIRAAYAEAVDATDLGFDPAPAEPSRERPLNATRLMVANHGRRLASVSRARGVR